MPEILTAAAPLPATSWPAGLIHRLERRPGAAFGIFLVIHFVVWTVLPALLYANLPLDLIEALVYGRERQLGYDKLPPLPWWLIEAVHRTLGADIAYYATAQAAVLIAFALVFALSRPLVGATGALAAVLIVDGLHYFQYTAVKFNHDVIQLPFWALAGCAFHDALRRDRLRSWALLGFAVGAALWAKYFVVVLAAPYALFMLIDRQARRAWATPGPWLAIVVALIVTAPHLIWLLQSDFLPFAYASHRAAPVRGWSDHLLHPLVFVGSQIFFLLPSFLIAAPLFWRHEEKKNAIDHFERRIVTFVAVSRAMAGDGGSRQPRHAAVRADCGRLGHGLCDLCRRVRRQLSSPAVCGSSLSRGAVSGRPTRRHIDRALPRGDRSAVTLCNRLNVGRRQPRALFAGSAAGADRWFAAPCTLDRSRRSARQRRDPGLDAEQFATNAGGIRGGCPGRSDRHAI